MKIIVKRKYNHLFFTEESLNKSAVNNSDFWIALQCLQDKAPQICVEIKLVRYAGILSEYPFFICDQDSIEKKCVQVRKDYYHPTPIQFCLEFSESNVTDQDLGQVLLFRDLLEA